MHNLEFAMICLATVLEEEKKETELAQMARSLASWSHSFVPTPNIDGSDPDEDQAMVQLKEELRARAGL